MEKRLNLFLSLLLLIPCLACLIQACGEGTETGNPGNTVASPTDEADETQTYTNETYAVSTRLHGRWSYADREPPAREKTGDGSDDADVASETTSGIDTSSAPFTEFTDEESLVTIYYVTLAPPPSSLKLYLKGRFPDRSFENFRNGALSGFKYDNPEAGSLGGDRQEYYFLKEGTLLYVVADLLPANDAEARFGILIDSLRFD